MIINKKYFINKLKQYNLFYLIKILIKIILVDMGINDPDRINCIYHLISPKEVLHKKRILLVVKLMDPMFYSMI